MLTETGEKRVGEARSTLERMAADLFRDRWAGSEIVTLADLLGRITTGQPGDLA